MAWWKAFVSWARRLFSDDRGPRVSGDPRSSNGASSMHLWWQLPDGERLTAVRATIEILEPPAVDRLYFWALQAVFAEPDGGAAHLGLQHNRRHPGAGAANFGGYSPGSEGGLLDGIESPLPSTRTIRTPGISTGRRTAGTGCRSSGCPMRRRPASTPGGALSRIWRRGG